MATASDLQQLYIGYFGRAADQEGLTFWLDAINNGGLSLDNVHASFVQSEEYTAQYENMTTQQMVAAVYENVLGRVADEGGLEFWTNAIETGVITEDQLIEGILSGLSTNDALIVSNKVTVANFYTSAKGDAYVEASKVESGNILDTVDGTTASVANALTVVADVTGVSNAELASALGTLDGANDALQAFAEAYLGDAATGTDADVTAAQTQISDALTTATTNLNDEINVLGGAEVQSTDTPAIVAQKIQLAQAAATSAVSAAQQEVSQVVGLSALVNTFNSQLATYEEAVESQTAADLEQTAELAKFNAIYDGTDITTIDDATGAATDGSTQILTVVDGKLVVNSAWAALSSTSAAEAAAANALLADVQARLAADKAVAEANTALDATGAKIDNIGTGDVYDATNNVFTADTDATTEEPVMALQAALAQQAALEAAVEEFNEAAAPAADLAELNADIIAAGTAITELGYILEPIDTATEAGTADEEVFVVGGTDSTVDITAGDVLFVGTGYTLGTDSDANTAGIQGGNDSALEMFIVENATTGAVELHVETSVFGSSAATPETTVITLAGTVTDVEDVSFDAQTGLVTFA
ncbi:DUF4214 domain-containing protein [Stutzerimonas urumqiensis]|uniref:DUF4214 domain-containing protein n=1 Tax=Stutzerimonas urumqiensis TaxID=638269 RepID=UPI000EAB61C5|nr:DUF4214 domain-containing protein [Stutzerimonas urumqiensis]